jgi:aldehyde:ferredoxin oxidoreductase
LIQEKTKRVRDFGPAGGVVSSASIGDMPAKNWQIGDWTENSEKISGQAMASTILTGRYYCKSCIIGCGREIEIKEGKYAGVKGAGPEYEGLAGLGSMLLLDDLEAVSYANELCNQYGLDVMSAGSCIAFAMEAYERGLITKEETGGIDLVWGNADAVIQMVHSIARREGLGYLLGEGVRRAAQNIGGEAQEFALEVKGLELAFHDPRSLSSLAANYATYPRGACHRGNSHQLERYAIPEIGYDIPLDRQTDQGKGIAAARAQDYFGLYNSLKLCQFIGSAVKPSEIVEWINLVTGWDMDLEEFLASGERASNLKRMYNYRCGMTRKDDTLPSRIMTERFKTGGAKDYVPHLGMMLAEYYEYRGWNIEGIPLPETLTRLGLIEEIQDLPSYLMT